MKTSLSLLTATSLLFAATTLSAQSVGTSHPESLDDSITVVQQPAAKAKPSPAIPVVPAPALHERVETAVIVTPPVPVEPAPRAVARPAAVTASAIIDDDDNSGVVTEVYAPANALPEGTLLHVKLSEEISTRKTEPNIRFNAYLATAIEHHGQVVIPAGAVLTGRITLLNSGHHIGKAAAIHLQPEFFTMPNGEHYKLNGQVIDLISRQHAKVTREGTILSNDPAPGMATAVGASTGVGALTGAVLGGGVGAIVGAGIGAGVSGTVWANQATSYTLKAGTEIIFSLNQPMLLHNASIAE